MRRQRCCPYCKRKVDKYSILDMFKFKSNELLKKIRLRMFKKRNDRLYKTYCENPNTFVKQPEDIRERLYRDNKVPNYNTIRQQEILDSMIKKCCR